MDDTITTHLQCLDCGKLDESIKQQTENLELKYDKNMIDNIFKFKACLYMLLCYVAYLIYEYKPLFEMSIKDSPPPPR